MPPDTFFGYTILVVEDDEEMQRLLEEELQWVGFQVIQAKNGTDALAQVENQKPDVVVSDFNFPDGGRDFFRVLCANFSSGRIIVLSAVRDEGIRREIKQFGVGAFLQKPIRLFDLLETIQRCLLVP